MLQLLIKLGLSEKEARVYLALLELAQDTVQNISQKAKINRATTYVILEKLKQHGLVSVLTEGKKTFYVAEDPHELENILEAQKREIEDKKNELKKEIDQLLAVHNKKKGKPIVRYFEGGDGLMALDRYGSDRLAKDKGEIMSLAAIDLIEEKFPDRRKESLKERISAGIKIKTIYTHKNGPLPKSANKRDLRESIFIPKKNLPISGTVAILPWGIKFYVMDTPKPYGVVIEDKDIADMVRYLYTTSWKSLKKSK